LPLNLGVFELIREEKKSDWHQTFFRQRYYK
jgi:hypothetical protein